jgi:hypothetical protein
MASKGGVDVDIDLELPILRAFEQLERNGLKLMDDALRDIANRERQAAAARAPGSIGSKIEVFDQGSLYGLDRTALLVGVKMDSSGDRIGNWLNYGTLGRRLKSKTKKPGSRYSRGPGSGIKPRRFIKPIPRGKQLGVLVDAMVRAARRAGFDARRSM